MGLARVGGAWLGGRGVALACGVGLVLALAPAYVFQKPARAAEPAPLHVDLWADRVDDDANGRPDGEDNPVAAAAWVGAIGAALLPVVTLPTGPSQAGLPVGVQVIGPFLSDLRLLRIAELLDATGPGFIPPPTSY